MAMSKRNFRKIIKEKIDTVARQQGILPDVIYMNERQLKRIRLIERDRLIEVDGIPVEGHSEIEHNRFVLAHKKS